MTHLLETSALLAHYLAEPGAARVQALFEDGAVTTGTSILALFEFDLRLHHLGMDESTRTTELSRYRALLNEIVNVDEAVRKEGIRLRIRSSNRVPSMDILIAATASLQSATLVHRDPHFAAIPARLLKQETLPAK
ncbi:MAG TPA: PIN domain-containing protein [Candidatus Saccharimonadales bacterium]|nr:PIN domain-containing protein [Candidatus Saccharimonadales bacterium]